MMQAVLGKIWSGVVVARTMRSISPGSTPAAAIAAWAAATARSEQLSPSVTMCRWRMPVRPKIHSSVVSTISSRSLLVTIRSGR
jgi:hypothetical protein